MAALSIVLGVLSLACMALGVVMSLLSAFGPVFLLAAPALAIAGIIVGGLAMSRAKRAAVAAAADPAAPPPASSAAALAGIIISSLALLPTLLSALTCGVCSALLSSGRFDVHSGDPRFGFGVAGASSPPAERPARDAGQPGEPDAPDDDAPPPAFPAPPLKP